MIWGRRLRQVFDIDTATCSACFAAGDGTRGRPGGLGWADRLHQDAGPAIQCRG